MTTHHTTLTDDFVHGPCCDAFLPAHCDLWMMHPPEEHLHHTLVQEEQTEEERVGFWHMAAWAYVSRDTPQEASPISWASCTAW